MKSGFHRESIALLNYGGPDRCIRQEDFISGRIRPRRYSNRCLGGFLKELDLTEGRAIKRVLERNNSPEPSFRTDDERTFFEVEIFCHPAFKNHVVLIDDAQKEVASNKDGNRDVILLSPKQKEILNFCQIPRSRVDIFNHLDIRTSLKITACIFYP